MIFKRALVSLLLVAVLLCHSPEAISASKYHEDPAATEETFSGLSLLLYYSDLLDVVQQGNLSNFETTFSKLNFANIPSNLKTTATKLIITGTDLSKSVTALITDWQKYTLMIEQNRFEDARELILSISGNILQTRENLSLLESTFHDLGRYLKIENQPAQSVLRKTYDEIIVKINRLKEITESVDLSIKEGQKLTEQRRVTHLSLEIPSGPVFPGDEVSLNGSLTSITGALAGREIEIWLDNARYINLKSDEQGFFGNTLKLPMRYLTRMSVQAVYHPADADARLYTGSISPILYLNVSFYQTDLQVSLDGGAYPGRETAVIAVLAYAPGIPLQNRKAEIYLDDYLIAEVSLKDSLVQKIGLNPDISVGRHKLIVSVEPQGRYAPVTTTISLDVIMAVTTLEMISLGLMMVPGNLELNGRLSSETGPLQKAGVKLKARNSTAVIQSDDEGYFRTKLLLGLGWDLLGKQTLTVEIQPEEPWNSPLTVSKSIFMINLPNCALLLVLLAVLSYYLPRRFKGRLSGLSLRRNRQYRKKAPVPALSALSADSTPEAASNPIFDLYRLALRLVTSITRTVLKPQQTLREFAGENKQALGPLSRYFNELTLLIERLLYSRHKATTRDMQKSQALYQSMEKESRHEDI